MTPTGLRLFTLDTGTLYRYDVDTAVRAPIRGLEDLRNAYAYTVPWGRGHAVVTTPRGEGGGYDNPISTVYRLPAGTTTARRIGTAHYIVVGQRPGEVAFIRHSGAQPTAVTYAASGRRLRTHRLDAPEDQPASIFAETPAGLGYVAFESETSLTVHLGRERRSYSGRAFVGGRVRTFLTTHLTCAVDPCSLFLGDMGAVEEVAFPMPAGQVVTDVVFSPDGARGIVRATVIDAEGMQHGENLYLLDVAGRTLTAVVGATRVDPLTTVGWASTGAGVFLASNDTWAYWTPERGLELLRSSALHQVVGVG